MPRLRAHLAVLLAVTWCLAAWHVDLEAAGMMFEHEHHAHDHASEHVPATAHDDYEQVFARDIAKDKIRVGGKNLVWVAELTWATCALLACGPLISADRPTPDPNETDPPFAHVWHFVQRCAPESAAPPVLG